MSNIIHEGLTWTTSIHIGHTWTYRLSKHSLSMHLLETNI